MKTIRSEHDLTIVLVSPRDNVPGDVKFLAMLNYLEEHDLKFKLLPLSQASVPAALKTLRGESVYIHVPDITYLFPLKDALQVLKANGCLLIVGCESNISPYFDEIMEAYKAIDAIVFTPETGDVLTRFSGKTMEDIKFDHIPGIAFRKPGREIDLVVNNNPPPPDNIDHLSSLELFNFDHQQEERYPIIVSQGCRFNCQYCGFQDLYSRGRSDADESGSIIYKSPRVIVDEIEWLEKKGITKFVFFCHQFFKQGGDSDDYVRDIASEILKRNIKIEFQVATKPSLILQNVDVLDLLRKAGLVRLNIGLDSGVERFHRMYQTGSTVRECIDALKYLHENRIPFITFFVFYDPYLTAAELQENILFLTRIMPYYSHLSKPFAAHLDSSILNSVLVLKPGMPINAQLQKDDLLIEPPDIFSYPRAKFRDIEVLNIYSIYDALNDYTIKKINRLFHDPRLVKKYPFLNSLLLNVMAEIMLCVRECKFETLEEYVSHMDWSIKETLKPYLGEITSTFPEYGDIALK
jgi:radical SAM superfamily enzyme YgiQ (UPF0313 family)